MRSYFYGLLNGLNFSGRATRSQYWIYFLVQILIGIAAAFIDLRFGDVQAGDPTSMQAVMAVSIIHIVPNLSIQVRRLHDIGRSGWWWLLNIVPFGGLVLLFWACVGSESGANAYGNPQGGWSDGGGRESRAPATTIPRQVRMGSAPRQAAQGSRTSGGMERFI